MKSKGNIGKIACFFSFVSVLSLCLADEKPLRQILDEAVAAGQKNIKLSGTYFLEKPLSLDSRFSGVAIDGRGETLVSGGKKVAGWYADGKYLKAKLDADSVEALFVNGKRATPAQTDIRHIYGPSESDPQKDVVVRISDIAELENVSPKNMRSVYLDCYSVWYNSHLKIAGTKKNADGLTATVHGENPHRIFRYDKNPRFRIVNVFAALDGEGEFYFDRDKKILYYIPRKGETAENIEAYYPTLSRILEVVGNSPSRPVENLSIRGISFAHGGHFPDGHWDSSAQAAFPLGGFVFFKNVKNIDFSGNKVSHCNTYGLELSFGVSDAAIAGNEFFDNGAGGIRVGYAPRKNPAAESETRNVVLRDNIVYSYGRYAKAGVGIIVFDCANRSADHNTVFDGYYTGISFGWTWGYAPTKTVNNKITNNRIFKIGHGLLCDMGGIYTLGSHKGSVISGNEICDVRRHRYGGWGIYNDEGSADFIVENNYTHNLTEDGYHQHYGLNNVVRNNVFTYGDVSQVALSRLGEKYPDELVFTNNIVVYRSPASLFRNDKILTRTNAKFDKNIYWNENGSVSFSGMTLAEWQKKYGQDINSFVVNPALKDGKPTNGEYKKIGFRPFSTADSGVRGKMKTRLNEILAKYEFPPLENVSVAPKWTKGFRETLASSLIGGRPTLPHIDSNNGGFDICVLEEGGSRFMRFIDSRQKNKTYNPSAYYRVSLADGATAKVSFDMRVNKTSTFFVECRGDTGFSGPMLSVEQGRAVCGKSKVALPFGKWLNVEMTFKAGADKSYSLKIYDGKNAVFEGKIPSYKAAAMSSLRDIVVAQTSNSPDAYFDLRNLAFDELKRK